MRRPRVARGKLDGNDPIGTALHFFLVEKNAIAALYGQARGPVWFWRVPPGRRTEARADGREGGAHDAVNDAPSWGRTKSVSPTFLLGTVNTAFEFYELI